MDITTLTAFFGWATVFSSALFLFMTLASSMMPDISYQLQTKFFAISKDEYTITIYRFLALFKLFIIVLFFVPFLALKFIA